MTAALKNLGGAAQPVPVVGHRIALALQKNDTNWVAAVAAGLYWRVEGDFQKAVNCYRLALTFAPRNLSDYALAGYANIFTQGKLYYNAIISIDMALEIRHWIPTYHFMIGNAFAAIEQYPNAAAFYETSRFYMPDYRPSTDRLKAFYCQRVKHF